MIKILENIKFDLEYRFELIHSYFYNKRMKRLYPDYKDDEYNQGEYQFIWGITSWDDITGKEANMYTMNDIEIDYNRKIKQYSLSIETAYLCKNPKAECDYLRDLLNAFTKFMDDNNYSKDFEFMFFMSSPITKLSADSIEELYANFRIFVEGYCQVYDK